jgi:hypothetical protein
VNKVVYGPFFHGGNTGSNPIGDAKSFPRLNVRKEFPLVRIRLNGGRDFADLGVGFPIAMGFDDLK